MSQLSNLANHVSALRDGYYERVRSNAAELAKEIFSRDIADRESLFERVREEADSFVIYTFDAKIILLCSEHADLGLDELGVDGFDWKSGISHSALAFWAYREDLLEAIGDIDGIDLNDDDLGRGEEGESAEDE